MSWRQVQFRDFVTLQRGFDLPETEMQDGDVPVLGSNCVIGFHNEAKVQPPGVITGRSGTLGEVQFVNEPYWPHNTALWVRDFKGNLPRFVYYKLQTLQLDKFSSGASVPTLNRNNLDNIPVKLPSNYEQERIADVLSAHDELIENNRRRMRLLEEAARLLYREWFVRFRFPGHEHTRILDGIPQGWERKTLIDVCGDLQDGDWIESKDQGGDDYRLLQVSNIGVNEFLETGNMRFISEETFRRLNCREVKPGQLLISRMPTPIGRAWLVTEMPWKMVTAVDVTILTANDDIADRYFLLHHLNSAETLQQSEGRAVGATRPRIARREFARIPVTVPPSPWQREFRDVVRPMNELRARLYQQNQKLRAARDLLLPRLMSGEMAVPGGP